jgi:phosphatidylserine/phosphatidylglycerophosphate/cardiolipin synthase-like enzyme
MERDGCTVKALPVRRVPASDDAGLRRAGHPVQYEAEGVSTILSTKITQESGPGSDEAAGIFKPERNCWRIARADRVGLIVDAADYFVALRRVMIAARRELLMIGWDFDFEIEMLPGQTNEDGLAPDGYPNTLGDFIEAVVERSPRLQMYILQWNGALLLAPGRILPTLKMQVFGNERIHFALDGHHPFGACHHHKIVVADDSFAFCGGIDTTEDRWDTSAHAPDDPRRVRKDGSPSVPWHDATSALTGPAAQALGEISRRQWKRATGDELDRPDQTPTLAWPDCLDVATNDVQVAIARTQPPYDGEPLVNEIENLYLDAIAAAKKHIYIESQYFSAETICEALEGRLIEPDGPEIVVLNPQAALESLEDEAMHVLRGRMIRRLKAADPGKRFRILHPVNAAEEPIYVHAKVFIVDDQLLHIGSSNLDDRSMGFDTECDIAFAGHDGAETAIAAFRTRLLAEHLDTTTSAVEEAHARTGSLIGSIEALNRPNGRGLRPIERLPEDLVGRFLASTRLLDPRFLPRQATSAGRGIRPRHLALAAGAAVLGLVGWLVWRKVRAR